MNQAKSAWKIDRATGATIFMASFLNRLRVSSPRLRRRFGFGAAALPVNAFFTFPNSRLIASPKVRGLALAGGAGCSVICAVVTGWLPAPCFWSSVSLLISSWRIGVGRQAVIGPVPVLDPVAACVRLGAVVPAGDVRKARPYTRRNPHSCPIRGRWRCRVWRLHIFPSG
jgi:hypothetical protein